MTKKYEIAFNYIKDLSVEVPDAETFILSKEYITKYSLGINVTTKGMKNDFIEVITKLHYKDPNNNNKKSFFEITYATVVKIIDKNLKKKRLRKNYTCWNSKWNLSKFRKNISKYNKRLWISEFNVRKKSRLWKTV